MIVNCGDGNKKSSNIFFKYRSCDIFHLMKIDNENMGFPPITKILIWGTQPLDIHEGPANQS